MGAEWHAEVRREAGVLIVLRPPRLTCPTTDLSGDCSRPRPAWRVGLHRPLLSNALGELGPAIPLGSVVGARHSSPDTALMPYGRDGRGRQAGQGTPKVAPLARSSAGTGRFTRQDVVVVGSEEGESRASSQLCSRPREEPRGSGRTHFPREFLGCACPVAWGRRTGLQRGLLDSVAGVRLFRSPELPCGEHVHKPERTRSSSWSCSLGFA